MIIKRGVGQIVSVLKVNENEDVVSDEIEAFAHEQLERAQKLVDAKRPSVIAPKKTEQ